MDLRIAILASHEGTTLKAILDACATGVLRAQVVTVVSNNRDAGPFNEHVPHARFVVRRSRDNGPVMPVVMPATTCG